MAFRLESGDDDFGELHEINVTPFIDVMLVLLIIFMVAAPLASVDVPVDLPGSTTQQHPRPDKPIFLSVKADHSLALGDTPITKEALAAAIDAATSNNKDERVFLRADKSISYGDLMEVMDELRGAGYLKVALVGLEGKSAK